MTNLLSIREMLQQTADALAAVLQVQVDIVDQNLKRIVKAGTSPDKVGVEPESGQSYRYVLAHGKPLLIERPRAQSVCLQCAQRKACKATAEIVWPIAFGDVAIGCIGLVTVDEIEKERLMGYGKCLAQFISKMSELISAKVAETEKTEALKSLASSLENVLHAASDGMMAIQPDRRILTINPAACRILGIGDPEKLTGKMFGVAVRSHEIEKCLKNQREIEDEPITLCLNGMKAYCMGTVRLIRSSNYEGIVCVFRKLETVDRMAVRVRSTEGTYTFDDILGQSPEMVSVKERACKVADGHASVLLLGDTGTGKEMFARAIHSASPRAGQPFVAVNCCAIPDSLLESELFGYKEGAFTGARRGGKPGKFELASDGTLFLDEIGDMALHMQAKLLRILEEGMLERLGATKAIPVNVRIIAATHRDLPSLVEAGKFRRDLYYRLNVVPIRLPLLRNRPEDIELLAHYFLKKYARIYQRNIKGFSKEAMCFLKAYQWPGNVRELQNTVEYAVNIETQDVIMPNSLTSDILGFRENNADTAVKSMRELERTSIARALQEYGNDTKGKRMAAQALGIHLSTLYRKIKSLEKDS